MQIVGAVAQAQQAASQHGGRTLSSPFDEEQDPMKRRKVATATDGEKNAAGAVCFFCA